MFNAAPELVREGSPGDYEALAMAAMASSGEVHVGESWSRGQLGEVLGVSNTTTDPTIKRLRGRGWIQPGSWTNEHGRDRTTVRSGRPPILWQSTPAFFDMIDEVGIGLLDTASPEVLRLHNEAVYTHVYLELQESDFLRGIVRTTCISRAKELARLQGRPSRTTWFEGSAAWYSLAHIVAHNAQSLAADFEADNPG